MVQEPLPLAVVPVVLVESRVLSVMREFEKRHPPIFSRDLDPVEAELWLKRVVHIFEYIGLVEDYLRIDVATF